MAGESDSYLDIAEAILSRARMPLSARQIINLAYVQGLMPTHLYGSTQHKTVGARLSEDILEHRENSRFFRTRPGRFFLRGLINETTLPIEFRTPIVARRRKRMLSSKNIASIPFSMLHHYLDSDDSGYISPSAFTDIIDAGLITYSDRSALASRSLYPIHSFAILRSTSGFLRYNRRPYADPSGTQLRQQSIGFSSPVVHDDLTLFDRDDHGAVISALTSVSMDLDLEYSQYLPYFEAHSELIGCYLVPTSAEHRFSILTIVEIQAPEEFLPVGKRLSVGNMGWVQFCEVASHPLAYDEWTRYLFNDSRRMWGRLRQNGQQNLLI